MKMNCGSRVRPAHGRQNNNNKSLTDYATVYRSMPMGDGPVQAYPNFSRQQSDSVSCWGDAPKRSTHLSDYLNEVDSLGTPTATSPVCDSRTVSPQTNPSTSSENQLFSGNFKTPITPQSPSLSSAPVTSTNTVQNKSSGTAGREKLLEWLRASQAKRDENNRLVFTRWIDRMDNMNNTEVAPPMSNFAGSTVHHSDVSSCMASLFQNPTPIPGLMTTPTFVLSSPVGLMAPTIAPTGIENVCPYSASNCRTTFLHTNANAGPGSVTMQNSNDLVRKDPPKSSGFVEDSTNGSSAGLQDEKIVCDNPSPSLCGSSESSGSIVLENSPSFTSHDLMVTENHETETNGDAGHPSSEVRLPYAGFAPAPYYFPLQIGYDSNSPYLYYYYYYYHNQQPNTVFNPAGYTGHPMVYFLQQPQQTVCYSPAFPCTPVCNTTSETTNSLETDRNLRVRAEEVENPVAAGYVTQRCPVQSDQLVSDPVPISTEEPTTDPKCTLHHLNNVPLYQERTNSALEFDVPKWYSVLKDVEINEKTENPRLTKHTEQTHFTI